MEPRVCRNTLMYLTAETQARVLARFNVALGPSGALFPGKAEMLLAGPVAQVVVTADGQVALVSHQTDMVLGVSVRDKARPFRDPDLSYAPSRCT